ncbi:MAG: radical SAM protein [Bacteroidota bacterium]
MKILSHYLVQSEPFFDQVAGYHKTVLLSTRTTKLVAIPTLSLEHIKNAEWEKVNPEILRIFEESEIIVDSEENELATMLGRANAKIESNQALNYTIQPSANCQLGCDYCGQVHEKKVLPKPYLERIVNRIKEKLQAKRYKHLQVGWFGGEPLTGMASIRSLSKEIIQYTEAYGCTYNAEVVTNGVGLTRLRFWELVNDFKVNSIEVTLDGTAEYHDQRRHTKDGSPTFDKIFQNLVAITSDEAYDALDWQISVRCNVDQRNDEGVSKLIKLMASHGMQKKVSFYLAPIHSWGNEAHLLSHEKAVFAAKEIDWMIELYQYGFPISLVPPLKPIVCMSVTEDSELVDTYGRVYNCTEVSQVPGLEKEYMLGRVGQKAPYGDRFFMDFNQHVLEGQFPCSTCEMLPVCGGACPKSWYEGIAACPSNKFNIKEKILMAYAISQSDRPKEIV